MRICNEPITALAKNEIAVCGSNLAGRHGAGFARYCAKNFAAKYGVFSGLTGKCYMIPTKDRNIKTLPISDIEPYVSKFIEYAKANSDKIFKVSSIGCGLAGYTPAEMAPLFQDAVELSNVELPKEFWDVLNEKK